MKKPRLYALADEFSNSKRIQSIYYQLAEQEYI